MENIHKPFYLHELNMIEPIVNIGLNDILPEYHLITSGIMHILQFIFTIISNINNSIMVIYTILQAKPLLLINICISLIFILILALYFKQCHDYDKCMSKLAWIKSDKSYIKSELDNIYINLNKLNSVNQIQTGTNESLYKYTSDVTKTLRIRISNIEKKLKK